MMLLVGVLVVLANWARQPGVWNWFDKLAAPIQVGTGQTIDNRLNAPHKMESPDSFSIPKEQPAEEEKVVDRGDLFPGVNPAWFKAIRDDAISSRDEQPCTLALLNILQKTDLDRLRKASMGRIAYAQLFRQPGEYRGRLVTVSGTVHGVYRVELPENQYGLKEYYQVWLAPPDNRFNPLVIYCLNLPKGFPTGDNIAEEAEVTGFFLKRWVYRAKDTLRVAPTLLAKTLQWEKRPVMQQESPADARFIAGMVVVVFLLAMLTALFIYLRTRPSRFVLPEGPLDFEKLRSMEESRESQPNTEENRV
jgi:hypothetical protein